MRGLLRRRLHGNLGVEAHGRRRRGPLLLLGGGLRRAWQRALQATSGLLDGVRHQADRVARPSVVPAVGMLLHRGGGVRAGPAGDNLWPAGHQLVHGHGRGAPLELVLQVHGQDHGPVRRELEGLGLRELRRRRRRYGRHRDRGRNAHGSAGRHRELLPRTRHHRPTKHVAGLDAHRSALQDNACWLADVQGVSSHHQPLHA
mmetsp:Transcript_23518/g.52305  ORF Transcript_23518/g.52305 Transcript_23518/m.52305 type:complete len:202 (+) Transcript_23518:1901-2506(+)